jgi:hypothetical protein
MTIKTTMTRTIRLAVGTAAVLALMSQAAQAKPLEVFPTHTQAAPSSSTYQGTYRPTSQNVTPSPDRADRIGSSQAYLGQPVKVSVGHTSVPTSSGGFDWVAATLGAGSTLAIVLIAGAGLAARGRRGAPLSV